MFPSFIKTTSSHLALGIALIAGAPAFADTTLTGNDGTLVIEGELLDTTEENFVIRTDLGELNVRREFVTCSGDGCPEEESAEVVVSDDVVLTSSDGQIRIEGVLVDFTSTSFVINTSTGQLNVRREFTTCEGQACPGASVESDRFSVTVVDASAANLVRRVVSDYASAKDFNLTQQSGGANSLQTLLIGNEQGLEISRISMQQFDANTALKALIDGDSQFMITNDRITPVSLSAQIDTPVSDVSEYMNEEIIGLDAISFVVSNDNGIDVISLEAIRSVLSGQITNWSQLGGANQPITLHALAESADLLAHLETRGMANVGAFQSASTHTSADAMNTALQGDSNGIGVMYRSQADGIKALNLASSCNIFVDNSDFAIQTEEHPFALRWYQYTLNDGMTSDFARNVGQFIPTDFGQQSIASLGLVTQQLQIVPMQDQGARLLSSVVAGDGDRASNAVMREYFSEASNARRISTSLRFLSGNAALDTKAESDLDRISTIVRSSEYEGYEILVFGFSDSFGTLNSNLSLSKRRAESVKQLLLNKNPGYLNTENVSSFGIGPIAPVGCNEVAEGREQNRRVEIWVRPRA